MSIEHQVPTTIAAQKYFDYQPEKIVTQFWGLTIKAFRWREEPSNRLLPLGGRAKLCFQLTRTSSRSTDAENRSKAI